MEHGWIHLLANVWRQTLGGVGALSLATAAIAATATTDTAWIHPTQLPQPSNAPAVLTAYVEIPKGSTIKYEVDPATGHLKVDRFLPESFSYPQAYGFLPALPAADGDWLDVFIITDQPIQASSVIEVRPVGLIRMRDGGDADHKLLAVPATSATPTDLDEKVIEPLRAFLTQYKAQSDEPNPIEWLAVDDQARTLKWLARRLSTETPPNNAKP